jgi:uncharacterized metal-binding protein
MAECCGSKKPKPAASSCCGGSEKKTVLLYACSGGANVAEVADRAARDLMVAGGGTMFCLAGLGADLPDMVEKARAADLNLVIDGCPVDCAKRIFDRHGLANYRQIKVTDLGIEKVKGVRGTPDQVGRVVATAKEVLAGA